MSVEQSVREVALYRADDGDCSGAAAISGEGTDGSWLGPPGELFDRIRSEIDSFLGMRAPSCANLWTDPIESD
jgi:hypothetical protein